MRTIKKKKPSMAGKIGAIILFAFIGLMIVGPILWPIDEKEEVEEIIEPKKVVRTFKEIITEDHFTVLGEHLNLGRVVQESQLDPSSYKFKKGGFTILNDSMYSVWLEYSGTNAFGGRVPGEVYAISDKDGYILEIMDIEE